MFFAGILSFLIGQPMCAQTFDEMVYSPKSTVFNLNAPTSAKRVEVKLYDDALGGKPIKTLSMRRVGNDRWSKSVKGDWRGKFYTFEIPSLGKGETPGTFAKAVGVNGKRGAIIDMKDTNPAGWDCDARPALASPADLVIYEMHHRDFSIDSSSGLRYKGKFLALTEPRAIEHLRMLGINAVHILPSYDYASVDETKSVSYTHLDVYKRQIIYYKIIGTQNIDHGHK